MLETLFSGPVDAFDDEAELGRSRVEVRRLITFELSGEWYGLPITDVAEIHDLLPITPLPPSRVPPDVLGLINVRGLILPVVDLRRKFGLPINPVKPENRLVVIKGPEYWLALWVEAVGELARLPLAAFQPAPLGAVKIESGFYRQVARLGERLLIELNTAKILAGAAAQGVSA